MSPAVYAYYLQILHDLQEYFELPSTAAELKILDWKFLNPKNQDLLPLLIEEEPYYYATQLVYEELEPDKWHLRTANPKNYQYCDQFIKVMQCDSA